MEDDENDLDEDVEESEDSEEEDSEEDAVLEDTNQVVNVDPASKLRVVRAPRQECALARLRDDLAASPFDAQLHEALLATLRQAAALEELRAARLLAADLVALPEALWVEWLEDERRVASDKDFLELDRLHRSACTACPHSARLWLARCALLREVPVGVGQDVDCIRRVYEEALATLAWQPQESPKIWSDFRNFEEGLLAKCSGELERFAQARRVRSLFFRQLALPLASAAAADELCVAHSDFEDSLSENARDPIAAEKARAIAVSTAEDFRERMAIEQRLLDATRPMMVMVGAFSDQDVAVSSPAAVSAELLAMDQLSEDNERILLGHLRATYFAPKDLSQWLAFINFASKTMGDVAKAVEVAGRAVLELPGIPQLWQKLHALAELAASSPQQLRRIIERGVFALQHAAKERAGGEEAAEAVQALLLQHADACCRMAALASQEESLICWQEMRWALSRAELLTEGKVALDNAALPMPAAGPFHLASEGSFVVAKPASLDAEGAALSSKDAVAIGGAMISVERASTLPNIPVAPTTEKPLTAGTVDAVVEARAPHRGSHYHMRRGVMEVTALDVEPDAFSVAEGDRTVYVSNLDWSVNEATLFRLFGEIEGLKEVRIVRDFLERSKGYAYADFQSSEQVAKVVDLLNGRPINGRPMKVARSLPTKPLFEERTLFVTNIAKSANEVDLHQVFARFGNIKEIRFPSGENKGSHKGYAYIEYLTIDAVKAALQAASAASFELSGQSLEVSRSIPMKDHRHQTAAARKDLPSRCNQKQIVRDQVERNDPVMQAQKFPTTVYVKDLALDVDDEKLTTHFSQCGKVVQVLLCRNARGRSRGFGFVEFVREDQAQAALLLTGSELCGRSMTVSRSQRAITQKKPLDAAARNSASASTEVEGRASGVQVLEPRGNDRGSGNKGKTLVLRAEGKADVQGKRKRIAESSYEETGKRRSGIEDPSSGRIAQRPRLSIGPTLKEAASCAEDKTAKEVQPMSNADFRALLLKG